MSTDTGIIYIIAVGCSLFGVVTAYLIYKNVQQEKALYFRHKLRRKQLQKDAINYDYTAPKEKKRPPSGTVVEPEADKPASRNGIPVPAPILAPIAVPPIPVPEPAPTATHDTAPLLDNSTAVSNNDALFTAAPAAAVGGAAAGAGAFAAYQTFKTEPVNHPVDDDQPKKTKKSKKRKGSIKKVSEEDFDDYRNFTPTVLPPPKGAPPKANYTPSGSPEVEPPQYVQTVNIESDRPGRDLSLPPVAIVNREGLRF